MPIRAQHCPDNTLARRWRIRYRLARSSPVREWFVGRMKRAHGLCSLAGFFLVMPRPS